jgi:hypothetical protein
VRDISIITAIVAIVLGSIGFAVPANSDAAKRYRTILWALAGAFLAFNILLWRSTSLDVAQYGSCLLDSTPEVCAPARDTPKMPGPSGAEVKNSSRVIVLPFPINQSWAGTASADMKPPQPLPKQLTVRIYRADQSDELLLRFGECVERMQLTAINEHSRVYSTNTDLTLSGGWGKHPWPCWYSDWIEKFTHRDNVVTLSYENDALDTLIYERIAPNETGDSPATVYRGRLMRD